MGTVIKASGAGRIKRNLQTFALKDHMAEAHRVIADAHGRAEELMQEARKDAERMKQDARRLGYTNGYAMGLDKGREKGHEEAFKTAKANFIEQQQPLIGALQTVSDTFESRIDNLIDRARRDVLILAVAIAERVTKRVGILDTDAAAANAEAAIRSCVGESDLVIHVNPRDAENMRIYASKIVEQLAGKRHIRFAEDENIEPGGAIVESAATRVDATLATQFKHAAEILLGQGAFDEMINGMERTQE